LPHRILLVLVCLAIVCFAPSAFAAGNVQHDGGNVFAGGNVTRLDDGHEGVTDKTPLDADGRPLVGPAITTLEGQPALLAGSYPQGEDNINVLHYELRFNTIDFTSQTVAAVATLTIEALEPLPTELVVDFRGFTITQVLVDGTPTTFSRLGTNSAKLHVDLPAPVGLGELVELTVAYSGTPTVVNSLGLLFKTAGGGQFACTMAEPNGAHLWFPCNDRPDDKATLDLYATVEDGRVVGSNGALISETLDGGRRTFHWSEAHPISTYLIVMDAGDYTYLTASGAPVPLVGYFTSSGAASGATGLAMLPAIFVTYEDAFGPYPFDKYGHAEMPNFNYGGMEHQTLTTLHSAYLASEWVIAHEFAHMWWGDLVGPASWDDIWLNEGFATYAQGIETVGKNRDAIGVLLPDYKNWSRALNDPDYNNLFDGGLVYNRGAWTLHHLRSYLGEEKFWPALLHYRDMHAFGSASSEDLKLDFEASSGLDLDSLYDRFVYHAGEPTIDLTYYCDTRTGLGSRVIVRYKRTDGFACSDVAFIRLNFSGGERRVVRCVWHDPGTFVTAYDDRAVTSIEINPLDDYPGTITSSGTLSDASADGDTLPDGWELATLGTLTYADADDPDGDGYPNSAELEADTNPADEASAPVIRAIARTGSGAGEQAEITYDTSVFAYYTVETTTTPEDQLSWAVAEPKARGAGGATVWTDPIGSDSRAFYRLRVSEQ
jgi:hypothetical protein